MSCAVLVRQDLRQLFVSVDRFTDIRVGDVSTVFMWGDIVWFALTFRELFGHPLFGCFHDVCQSFVYSISFDNLDYVGYVELW